MNHPELYKYVINLSLALSAKEERYEELEQSWEKEKQEIYDKLTLLSNNINTISVAYNSLLHAVIGQNLQVVGEPTNAFNSERTKNNEKYDQNLRQEESRTGILCDEKRGEISRSGQGEEEENDCA